MSGQLTVETPKCIMCGKASLIEVDADAFRTWQAGALIQIAFPHLSAEQRELLLNGIHPACWDTMIPEEDDDDELLDRD